MVYLISQLWPLMVCAFVAGGIVGWRRGRPSRVRSATSW